MLSANVEHYLRAIYDLSENDQPVSLSALAEELVVSHVSANEMVKKLTQQGWVNYKPYKGVTLTPSGATRALAVTRRHRLWERFLTDFLMIPWDQVHEHACNLEHATSPLVEEHLAQFLGQPETCPHGHPIPDTDGNIADIATHPLSALKPGQTGVVQSVIEEPELLQYLESLGLVPRAQVRIDAIGPFDGPMTIRIGDAQHILGWNVASQIQVRLN